MEKRPFFPGLLLKDSKNPVDRKQLIQLLSILAHRGQMHMNLFSNILETQYVECDEPNRLKQTDKIWYMLIGWTRTYDFHGMDLELWCKQWMPFVSREIQSVQQWDVEAILNLDTLAMNQILINDNQLPFSPKELEDYWNTIAQNAPKDSIVANWANNLLDVMDELIEQYENHFIKKKTEKAI
jgi:hypothetical protein